MAVVLLSHSEFLQECGSEKGIHRCNPIRVCADFNSDEIAPQTRGILSLPLRLFARIHNHRLMQRSRCANIHAPSERRQTHRPAIRKQKLFWRLMGRWRFPSPDKIVGLHLETSLVGLGIQIVVPYATFSQPLCAIEKPSCNW